MGTILVDTSNNPWRISATGGTGTVPVTIVGVQNTGNQAYVVHPKRIQWVALSAVAGNGAVVKDVPGVGGTGTPRIIFEAFANGANFDLVEERPRAKEGYVGLQVTQLDAGDIFIYI